MFPESNSLNEHGTGAGIQREVNAARDFIIAITVDRKQVAVHQV